MEILTARIAVFYHFILEGILVGVFSDFNPYFEVRIIYFFLLNTITISIYYTGKIRS